MKNIVKILMIMIIVALSACSVDVVDSNEGTSNEVSSRVAAGNGVLTGRITEMYVENGVFKHRALSHAGIFFDGNSPYGGPSAEATTDVDGYFTVELAAGRHTYRIAKMTSSHSYFVSDEYVTSVREGKTTETYVPVCPYPATFRAYHDAGYGYALYITGAGYELGHWQTAYKMNCSNGNVWSIFRYIPRGVEYKIVKAPWVSGDSISTQNVSWENGYNHVAHAGLYVVNSVTPSF